ncbi:hypothetical protein [Bacillus spizizenii]|uniref:hypothetical protein n=1 Tax=Bacillus spizizenii TaxID=96241 RepID=UPI002FC79AC6
MAEIQTIEVVMKRSKTGWARKLIFFPMAAFGFLGGALLCLTIVGIIPGFFIMAGSVGLVMAGLNYRQVKCPNCKKKNYVVSAVEDFKCSRCGNPTIIEWKKPRP